MARYPRFDLAGIPQHIVQRGNNRLPCFLDDEDRQRYLQCLKNGLLRFDCQLHAYVLMDNHAHLLLTPSEPGAVSRLMHTFARNYAGFFNARHGRTGTLWEGRYKACVVDSEGYVLSCYRYIELNPVRGWMMTDPGEHPWSSFRSNALGQPDSLLTAHAAYGALAAEPTSRCSAYRALCQSGLPDADLAEIRRYLQQQRALGSDAFQREVEARILRFAGARAAHRPRKKPAESVPDTL